MTSVRRAKTVMIRPTYESNRRFHGNSDDYYNNVKTDRATSPSSSESSTTTYSEQQVAPVQAYVPPPQKPRSKTSVRPFYHLRHSGQQTDNITPMYTENQLADLHRIKQYVRDLQIEIDTLRRHHYQQAKQEHPSPPQHQQQPHQQLSRFCEDCQHHRKRYVAMKDQNSRLKIKIAGLSNELESANKVITELQDENTALSEATKSLKRKAEKLLRLVQKRDALREQDRHDAQMEMCKHRHCKPEYTEVNEIWHENGKDQDAVETMNRKWERFRHEVGKMKDDEQGYEETAHRLKQRQRDQQLAHPRNQHQKCCGKTNQLRQTESERVFLGNVDDRKSSLPPTMNKSEISLKKKFMSASDLDKWSHYYAKRKAGNLKRQERTTVYLANYNIPQKRGPSRTMSAEERLQCFRTVQDRGTAPKQMLMMTGKASTVAEYGSVNGFPDFRPPRKMIGAQSAAASDGTGQESRSGIQLGTISENPANNSYSKGKSSTGGFNFLSEAKTIISVL